MRPKIGIKTRLLAVALVPSVALMAFAYQMASPRQRAAGQADAVRRQTSDLSKLVNLRFTILAERVTAEIEVRTRGYGLSVEQASAFLGYDIGKLTTTVRDRVASAAREAGDDGTQAVDALTAVRRAVDAGTAKQQPTSDAYEAVDTVVGSKSDVALARLVTAVDEMGDAKDMRRAIDALVESSAVVTAGREVQGRLAYMLIADGAERARLQLELLDASARLAVHREHFLPLAGPEAMVSERARTTAAAVVTLDQAVTRATQVDGATTTDLPSVQHHPERLAKIFAGTVDYQNRLYDVVKGATGDLLDAAETVQRRADRDFRSSALTATLVVAFALSWAMLNAFTLARPLRRLTRAVDGVREGRLDTPLKVGNHTREIAKVEDALVDLVDSLRVVERQASALAAGRLDEPVLAESVPGPLGQSLQQSVERLSSSISEERVLRTSLEHAATHDALTGLPNRFAALEHLERLLAKAQRDGRSVALLYVDLDDFKRANDSQGHAVGDRLLVEVAKRLDGIVRAGDLLARLGGDEFVIMFDDKPGSDGSVVLGNRIVDVLSTPFTVEGLRFTIGASVGIARNDDGDTSGEDLLKQADIALYRAKDRGRGRVEVFDQELQRQLDERSAIEDALDQALRADELVLHYQPLVSASSGRAASVEALVRWNRPGHGMVPPMSFIPIAEQSNLICDIGRWVLRRATRDLASWHAGGPEASLSVAVNVSGRHVLSGTLVHDVQVALDAAGLDPNRLTIEITETVLLDDLPGVSDQLEELRAMGVGIAIDDFGTGFTSLNHLRFLPADVIKIDRSFVNQLDHPREAPLVGLVIDIGHALGLTVVAEGVETAEQHERLRAMGCDRLQGYLFSRPLPAPDLVAWLAERAAVQSSSR